MKKRTYADKPLGDTEYLLEQWGWWRIDGMGVPSYVSPLAAIMSQANPMSASKSYRITDEVAAIVDAAVAKLTARDRQMGEFVWFYFAAKWPANRVGRENGVSERKAFELIKAGVAWVDSAIERLRESA